VLKKKKGGLQGNEEQKSSREIHFCAGTGRNGPGEGKRSCRRRSGENCMYYPRANCWVNMRENNNKRGGRGEREGTCLLSSSSYTAWGVALQEKKGIQGREN